MKKSTLVFFGLLVGLSLLTSAAWAQIGNLQEIIAFLQNQFGGGQFAMAFNIPAEKCQEGVIPDQNFFPGVDPQAVRNAMNDYRRIFVGEQLMGAKPKPIPGQENNYHSEYLLLVKSNPPKTFPYDPLVMNLLDIDPDGCVVFYTFNSPCVRTCSTPNGRYNIISALNMFRKHAGPKAFVFTQVWKHDKGTIQWAENIMEVNARLPLYRCDQGCVPCVSNNQVQTECLYN